MAKRKFPLKFVLSYALVLFVFTTALIISQPAIITGGGEMAYGFSLMIFWPLSSIISCFLQARLRTKWMWLAPFVSAALMIGLQLPQLLSLGTPPDIRAWGISIGVFSLVPSFLGLFLGLVLPKRTKKPDAS